MRLIVFQRHSNSYTDMSMCPYKITMTDELKSNGGPSNSIKKTSVGLDFDTGVAHPVPGENLLRQNPVLGKNPQQEKTQIKKKERNRKQSDYL